MGFHIFGKTIAGVEIDYYHYPISDKDRPLHKVLKVGHITDKTNEFSRTYSKGDLLQAQSELINISGTLSEQDFIARCITEANDTANKITITFN